MARNTPSSNGESVRQDMTSDEVYEVLKAMKPAESRFVAVISWVDAGYEGKVPALLDKVPFDREAFMRYAADLADLNGGQPHEVIQKFRTDIGRAAAMRVPDGPDIRIGELEG